GVERAGSAPRAGAAIPDFEGVACRTLVHERPGAGAPAEQAAVQRSRRSGVVDHRPPGRSHQSLAARQLSLCCAIAATIRFGGCCQMQSANCTLQRILANIRGVGMRLLIALGVLTLVAFPTFGQCAERIALLIGNKGYDEAVGPLRNTHNDVRLV